MPPGDDGFKVIDVVVEGISLLVTQRSDFAAVLKREGMDGFLDRLEILTQKANTGSSKTSSTGPGRPMRGGLLCYSFAAI